MRPAGFARPAVEPSAEGAGYCYHAPHRRIEPAKRVHGTPIIGIFSREESSAPV